MKNRFQMMDVETSKIISRQEIWEDLNNPWCAGTMAQGLAETFRASILDGYEEALGLLDRVIPQ